ncbi:MULTISPECIES: DUF4190 domain-containing protein [Streptomyces]|uniref:DUF4190 domain-containing protein n=2 Tax=Streptomyces TaxID=1883 RepID=A0A2N8PAP2_STRNR|nr:MULTISPECIES: DUF4190 domain-containing protein [Streptomyces]PNE38052.1 hypothetical protein AOB60_28240 [Streptomyces noursei]SHN28235.1 hypothetical protein SAMN05216268_12973 [Streptomyces yunnanensis]
MTMTAPGRKNADSGTEERSAAVRGTRGRGRDADGMAVAAFVLGLVGLLVGNVLLGPSALVLGLLALGGGTARRARAWSGIALGVADLVVLAVLVSTDGTVSWSL